MDILNTIIGMTTQEELTRLVIEQTGCEEMQAIEALGKTGNCLIDAIIYLDMGHIPVRTPIDSEDFAPFEWVKNVGHSISTDLRQSNDDSLHERGIRMDHYLSNMTPRTDQRPFDERLKDELYRMGITPTASRI